MKYFRFTILILTVFLSFSCDYDNTSTVPSEDFSFYFDLDDDDFFDNLDIGESVAITSYDYDDDDIKESVGYVGIILYHEQETVYRAYDLCCPIHVDEKEKLIVNGAVAMCPTDSIYYVLSNGGYPATNNTDYDGDASCLREYYTSYMSNGNRLRVYNY